MITVCPFGFIFMLKSYQEIGQKSDPVARNIFFQIVLDFVLLQGGSCGCISEKYVIARKAGIKADRLKVLLASANQMKAKTHAWNGVRDKGFSFLGFKRIRRNRYIHQRQDPLKRQTYPPH